MIAKKLMIGIFVMTLLCTPSLGIAQHIAMPTHTSLGHTPIHQEEHQSTQTFPPEERARRQVLWMDNNLKLTDEQHKNAYSILLTHAKRIDGALNMQRSNDRASEIRGINIQRDVAMKNVLNNEQYQKYQQHLQDVDENINNRRAGGMN